MSISVVETPVSSDNIGCEAPISVRDCIGTFFHEDHISLAEYMVETATGPLPDRSCLNPTKLPRRLLPLMMTWKFDNTQPDGLKFSCGLMGTKLVELLGYDLSRKNLGSCDSWFCRMRFGSLLSDAAGIDGQGPRIMMQNTIFPVGNGKVTCQQSAYPILNENGETIKILLLMQLGAFFCKLEELYLKNECNGFEWRQGVPSLDQLTEMRCEMKPKTFTLVEASGQ